MAGVELDGVSVVAGGARLLRDVSMSILDGEFLGVVGPSGSGKTTLLRAIGGLAPLASGRVSIAGHDVTTLPPDRRNVAMVFERPALLPRSVRRNVAFPLEVRHEHAVEIDRRVVAETRAMHIDQLLHRRPSELSDGEAQLVQIARALVRVPDVLLLDEPFATLDAHVRTRLRPEIGVLQDGYGVTTVMTTNEPEDVAFLPGRLAVLGGGMLLQLATPQEVRRRPASLTAAVVTGPLSTVPVVVEARAGGTWLTAREADGSPSLSYRVGSPAFVDRIGDELLLAVRPDDLDIADDGEVIATVERLVPEALGGLRFRVGSASVAVNAPSGSLSVGQRVRLVIRYAAVFDPVTDLAVG